MAQTPVFDWQGHRGCRGLMPENTIPAFKKALDLGVTTLEMDVVISKDRQVVVSHEPYFNPDISIAPDGTPVPKSPKINLYELPYADIKRYDVGSNGNKGFPEQQKINTYKPLLSEVIEAVEAYRKEKKLPMFAYNIEIKSEEKEYEHSQPPPAAFSDLVHAVIVKYLTPERVTLQSFDFNVLKYWHKQIAAGQYKKVQLAALVANAKGIEKNLEDLGFQPDIYSPYFQLLTADRVQQLHARGVRVIPWTINTTEDMRRVKALGVDGIITDYPDRVPKE
ncbi:MAG: glycerophosphodiester phosphodiesterase [Spirosomaceae bacterium]|nr:glycerophosphodiester phosphodiesterase [Spirosomataceae bacterium]